MFSGVPCNSFYNRRTSKLFSSNFSPKNYMQQRYVTSRTFLFEILKLPLSTEGVGRSSISASRDILKNIEYAFFFFSTQGVFLEIFDRFDHFVTPCICLKFKQCSFALKFIYVLNMHVTGYDLWLKIKENLCKTPYLVTIRGKLKYYSVHYFSQYILFKFSVY